MVSQRMCETLKHLCSDMFDYLLPLHISRMRKVWSGLTRGGSADRFFLGGYFAFVMAFEISNHVTPRNGTH